MAKIILAELKEASPTPVGMALKSAGYDILQAEDCGAVVELVRHGDVEVAIIDADLPPYGAATIVDSLKSDRQTCRVPVLVLCGPQDVGRAEEAVELGAHDYCLKPVDVHRLLGKLDLAVRTGRFRAAHPADGQAEGQSDTVEEERRVHPRTEVETPIQVVIDGITIDISESGMQIAAPVEMPDQLALTVVSQFIAELTGQSAEHVEARVVHHHRLNGKFAYGVSFLNMTEDVSRAIRRWIHSKK